MQRQYVEFLSDWRTGSWAEKEFSQRPRRLRYDCVAPTAHVVCNCREVASLAEIEEMEGALCSCPSFRKMTFVGLPLNRPLLKRLAVSRLPAAPKKQCDRWGDYHMHLAPRDKRTRPSITSLPHCPAAEFAERSTACRRSCPPSAIRTIPPGVWTHPRPSGAQDDLRQRLQMRLHHLRRPGRLLQSLPGIPRRSRLPAQPLGARKVLCRKIECALLPETWQQGALRSQGAQNTAASMAACGGVALPARIELTINP